MIDDSTVAEPRCVFCGCAVFYGLHEDFYGVFSCAYIDYLESVLHHVCGSGFFARVFSWSHEAVYEPFYDVYACFAEALVFVASHAVGQCHGRQVYVAF